MSLLDRLTITLVETKNYLRVDHNADDDYINDLIKIAIEQANAFLQNPFEYEDEETGELILLELPLSIKLACLKMVASWYEVRTDNIVAHNVAGFSVTIGEVPLDAEKLLHPYRKFVGV